MPGGRKYLPLVITCVLFQGAFSSDIISALAVTDDDRYLALGTASGGLYVFDISQGNLVLYERKAHRKAILDLGFHGEDTSAILLTGSEDRRLKSWGLSTGEKRTLRKNNFGDPLSHISMSPGLGNHYIYQGTNKKIFYCSVADPSERDTLFSPKFPGRYTELTFSKHYNDKILATTNTNKIYVWSVKRRHRLQYSLDWVHRLSALSVAGDNDFFLVADNEGYVVQYNMQTVQKVKTLRPKRIPIIDIIVSPENSYCIIAYQDSSLVFQSLIRDERVLFQENFPAMIEEIVLFNQHNILCFYDQKGTIYFYYLADFTTLLTIALNNGSWFMGSDIHTIPQFDGDQETTIKEKTAWCVPCKETDYSNAKRTDGLLSILHNY